jgi:hypothetical protein
VLPLATTTGTQLRPPSGDPYETAATPTTVATGLPSHISTPTGNEVDAGGQLERIDAVLLADASVDLRHTDLWRDDGTGNEYRVAWVRKRQGLGLDHIKAGLVAYDGAATGG